MSSYGYSNPNQSSVPASSQQNVARVVAPQPVQSEPMGFTGPPGSTAPPGGTYPPRPPIDDSLNHKKFILRYPSGSYVIYQRGDIVSYKGNLYEVMVRTFGMLPDIDNTIFRKINEKTDISIIDGGEF